MDGAVPQNFTHLWTGGRPGDSHPGGLSLFWRGCEVGLGSLVPLAHCLWLLVVRRGWSVGHGEPGGPCWNFLLCCRLLEGGMGLPLSSFCRLCSRSVIVVLGGMHLFLSRAPFSLPVEHWLSRSYCIYCGLAGLAGHVSLSAEQSQPPEPGVQGDLADAQAPFRKGGTLGRGGGQAGPGWSGLSEGSLQRPIHQPLLPQPPGNSSAPGTWSRSFIRHLGNRAETQIKKPHQTPKCPGLTGAVLGSRRCRSKAA